MTAHDFELDLTTHPDDGLVRFRLRNQDGQHLAAHQVRLVDHGAALWEGLFDTRSHVRRYAGSTRFTERRATAEDLLERIGVFLGEEVLGREVMDALSPRLAELLERPELDALKQVLDASGVVVEELQAGIDGLVEQVGREVVG
ncbi:MAG: hypothetical protein GY856_53090 [bacterium]|nr:hypothetical protein [bacterium]